jgi:hypothetical protein
MEFDVFAPELSLAIEYNGKQHYSEIYALGAQKDIAERDKEKREACQKVNTLILTPIKVTSQ